MLNRTHDVVLNEIQNCASISSSKPASANVRREAALFQDSATLFLMFFLLRRSSNSSFPPGSSWGSSLIVYGLFFVLFGMSILMAPELLAYIVATFLLLIGVSLVAAGWKMRR